MSFDEYETSVDAGLIAELYLWSDGEFELRETSHDAEVDLGGGDTYQPAAISRASFEESSDPQAAAELVVTVPREHAVAVLFRGLSPPEGMSLRILAIHVADVGQEVHGIWAGTVQSATPQGDLIEIRLDPITLNLKQEGPRQRDTRMCGHQLYNGRCGVGISQEDFTEAGFVATVSGFTITSAAFATQPDGWFNGGELLIGAEGRFIESHVGNTVTVWLPFQDAAPGMALEASAGCDRLMGTCNTKFGNLLNFGGAPWLPEKNVFSVGLTG